jgi:hypothetical protein
MRRNVLATELIFLWVLSWITGISVFAVSVILDWSSDALGISVILVGLVVLFYARPLQTWLAPRIGIAAPRPLRKRRRV